MKINFEETVIHSVTLTDKQIDEITIKRLKQILSPGSFIKEIEGKRKVCFWEDTGHGSGYTEQVRDATEIDEATLKIINYINSPKGK